MIEMNQWPNTTARMLAPRKKSMNRSRDAGVIRASSSTLSSGSEDGDVPTSAIRQIMDHVEPPAKGRGLRAFCPAVAGRALPVLRWRDRALRPGWLLRDDGRDPGAQIGGQAHEVVPPDLAPGIAHPGR